MVTEDGSGAGRENLYDVAYPTKLRELEDRWLENRPDDGQDGNDTSSGRVGFALSGGGIRSATFCLGLFQGIAKQKNLLKKIDYLSTVSGGGYFGSFLGRLFTRSPDASSSLLRVERILRGDPGLSEKDQQVFRNLRENGRYLSPNGSGDLLLGGAALFRNWAALHLVVGTLVLTFFLGCQFLRALTEVLVGLGDETKSVWFFTDPSLIVPHGMWWSPFLLSAGALVLVYVLPTAAAYWMVGLPRRGSGPAGVGNFWANIGLCSLGSAAIWYMWAELLHRPELNLLPGPAAAGGLCVAGFGLLVLFFWLHARHAAYVRAKARPSKLPWLHLLWVLVLGGLSVFGIVVEPLRSSDETSFVAAGVFTGIPLVAILVRLVPWTKAQVPSRSGDPQTSRLDSRKAIFVDGMIRNRLSGELKTALIWTGGILALGLVDSLGQTLYLVTKDDGVTVGGWIASIFIGLTGLSGFGRRIAVMFAKGPDRKRLRLPLGVLATLGGLLAVAFLLVVVNLASHALAWSNWIPDEVIRAFRGEGDSIAEAPGNGKRTLVSLAWIGGCLLAAGWMSLIFGQVWSFVNRSSHHPLYSARLVRAYLGASNPKRLQSNPVSVTDPVKDDDIAIKGYFQSLQKSGGPIHLLNVTVNETVDGRSQVQQQDRKGMGMAIGPCARSLGVRHHVLLETDSTPMSGEEAARIGSDKNQEMNEPQIYPKSGTYRAFHYLGPSPKADGLAKSQRQSVGSHDASPGKDDNDGHHGILDPAEPLSLGAWVAISGAAFTTGTGMRTSLGLSLLAGLANVRLGYWWDSGISPRKAPHRSRLRRAVDWAFPVQRCILREFLARFPGTARRHWYLSDGGHFENMGAYELIRRRLPLIVVVDAEADPNYEYVGLANLVRKARLDFKAEIEFLSTEEIDREILPGVACHIGSLDQLRRGCWKYTHAATKGSRPQANFEGVNPNGRCLVHAALARVRYLDGIGPDGNDSGHESRLLYIKPSLVGDEPEDVLDYHRQHPSFPQQTTGDQFFDESQWESYRRLGQHIAEKIFRDESSRKVDQEQFDRRWWLGTPDERLARLARLWHPDKLERR